MGTEEPVVINSAAESLPSSAKERRPYATTTTQVQQQRLQLPKASPPPQVIIIPATQASTVATNAAKKIRRAFSMPRNPFRWSRKFKTANASEDSGGGGSNSAITSCVGGGRGRAGSIVSLSSYEAVSKDTNGNVQQRDSDNAAAGLERQELKDNASDGKKQTAAGETGGGTGNRVLRRSSFRKFLNRIAQHVSSTVNVGAGKHNSSSANSSAIGQLITAADRVPPIGGYQWPADQTPGVMGLKNHGNTCFMNAVLQCLSHTDILAEYFVLDQYKADLKRRNKINSRKFGTKGELTEQLANVLKALWTCKNESDHSTAFKAVVDRYGCQFRSSTQQDAQEFLFWLLDKVHEDLNTATKRRYKSMKNTYGRPDEVIAAETLANHIRCNNSFVQAVFQAQFRSSLTCPRCRKQSNTFDPFHCISVQLPQLTQQTIFVTVVYLKQHPRQVKLGLTVAAGSPIVALREQLRTDTGIAGERMVLVDLSKEGFTRVFYDTQPVATLNGIDTIYCIEMPEVTPAAAVKGSLESSHDDATVATAAETIKDSATAIAADLLLLVANVRKKKKSDAEAETEETEKESAKKTGDNSSVIYERFGTPYSLRAPRDCSYVELQKKLLRELSAVLKPEVFSYATPLQDMFRVRLQDPSADPDTYLEPVEHPLLTEMIDQALSVLSAEAGPAHIKLLLEWTEPEQYFADLSDSVVEHESVARLLESKPHDTVALTLEQCLEHYTKAETLSAEDAWRCPHCQQYLPVVKTLGLWSLPDILVVHFKRFRQHQEKGSNAAKLTTMVKFPLHAFDMAPHLARGIDEDMPPANSSCGSSAAANDYSSYASQFYRPSPWKKTRPGDGSRSSTLNSRDNRETRYDLYAVCYHQGDTLETGHYTAACKNPYDRQWYKFDDQRVNKVPNEQIQEEIINNEAYMLFYQRRTGDAVECSGSSSNSGDHWVSRIAPPPLVPAQVSAEQLTAAVTAHEPTAATAEVEQLPGKAETKPVETPKANEVMQTAADKVEAAAAAAPQEALAHLVVTQKANGGGDAQLSNEPIDYADAAVPLALVDVDVEMDALQALESLASSKEDADAANADDANQIFVMDEECQFKEEVADNVPLIGATVKLESASGISSALKTKTTPLLTAAVAAVTTGTAIAIVNGDYERAGGNSPTQTPQETAAAGSEVRTASAANGSPTLSTASSTSSSRSLSPHSLAASVHGASTLQHKFNGYASVTPAVASAASSSTYKEVLLSSSLKSNSSCLIGATTVHEFQQLSRQQQQHWNGSRSSVSAVESVSQQTQQHAHCMNLRHSFSTSSSNYKLRECNETLSSMLRNSANTCSKDTLIFIDQQTHHHRHHHHSLMEDDDDTFMGSRSLWISPVTPHKLITVSPKN